MAVEYDAGIAAALVREGTESCLLNIVFHVLS
jgi:hypothetical protein